MPFCLASRPAFRSASRSSVSCLASRLIVSSHSIVPSCVSSCVSFLRFVLCRLVFPIRLASRPLRCLPFLRPMSGVPCQASRLVPYRPTSFLSCVPSLSDCLVGGVACGTVSPCSPLTIQIPCHALPCRAHALSLLSIAIPRNKTEEQEAKTRRGRDETEDEKTSRRRNEKDETRNETEGTRSENEMRNEKRGGTRNEKNNGTRNKTRGRGK